MLIYSASSAYLRFLCATPLVLWEFAYTTLLHCETKEGVKPRVSSIGPDHFPHLRSDLATITAFVNDTGNAILRELIRGLPSTISADWRPIL